ncbi:hypothetical protein II941_01935 [bacterium]|nr:hypothetical protein [bacterium]
MDNNNQQQPENYEVKNTSNTNEPTPNNNQQPNNNQINVANENKDQKQVETQPKTIEES